TEAMSSSSIDCRPYGIRLIERLSLGLVATDGALDSLRSTRRLAQPLTRADPGGDDTAQAGIAEGNGDGRAVGPSPFESAATVPSTLGALTKLRAYGRPAWGEFRLGAQMGDAQKPTPCNMQYRTDS